MNYVRALMVILVLGYSILRVQAQAATGKPPIPRAMVQVGAKSTFHYLQRALASIGYSARLYFHGTCGIHDSLRFPPMDVLPPTHGTTGVQAVREIFRNDKDVVVSADTSGLIRITKGSVLKPILDARLPSLTLTETEQYNPDGPGGAIDALESAPAVKKVMDEFRVHQTNYFHIGLESPALATLPHLPTSIGDATLDRVLDSIAKTFRGVVAYGECMHPDGSRTIDIGFYEFPTATNH